MRNLSVGFRASGVSEGSYGVIFVQRTSKRIGPFTWIQWKWADRKSLVGTHLKSQARKRSSRLTYDLSKSGVQVARIAWALVRLACRSIFTVYGWDEVASTCSRLVKPVGKSETFVLQASQCSCQLSLSNKTSAIPCKARTQMLKPERAPACFFKGYCFWCGFKGKSTGGPKSISGGCLSVAHTEIGRQSPHSLASGRLILWPPRLRRRVAGRGPAGQFPKRGGPCFSAEGSTFLGGSSQKEDPGLKSTLGWSKSGTLFECVFCRGPLWRLAERETEDYHFFGFPYLETYPFARGKHTRTHI